MSDNFKVRGENEMEFLTELQRKKSNRTLKIIGKHQNGLCEHCNVEEIIPHVFLECRTYEQEKGQIIEEIRKNGIQDLSFKVLINLSSEINSKVFFDFIREKGLIKRI